MNYPSITEILKEHGPLLSSEVADIYEKLGISSSAARQRVSRRNGDIKTLHGLPFPKKSKFLFLEGEFGTDLFYKKLISAIEKVSPSYSSAIRGLSARGGICKKENWHIVSCVPVKQKKQICADQVLNRLISVKLVREETIQGVGTCLALINSNIYTNYAGFSSGMVIESIIIEAIKSWSIKMGFGSINTVKTRIDGLPPAFGTCAFDIVSPSYLSSLTRKNNGVLQPGFFVTDVIYGVSLQVSHVEAFLHKIALLKALRSIPNFQPILIAAEFSPEALKCCRGKGIIAVTPETLFGNDIAKGLSELLRTLEKAAAIAVKNPEKIQELFEALTKIEGVEGNLRGSMFEMITAHIVSETGAKSVDIGALVTDHIGGRKAEIDVRAVNGSELICYECKGYLPAHKVTYEEVKEWLEKKIPIIRDAHNGENRFSGKKQKFEFWTTSEFEDDAIKFLEEKKKAISKYEINWCDGKQVLEQAKLVESKKTICDILKQYYFKHPVVKVLVNK